MPNVRDPELRRYIQAYHAEYRALIESLADRDVLTTLPLYVLLDAPVTTYISTMSGAGYEYIPGGETGTVVGSRPVEELLFDAPSQVRRRASRAIHLENALSTQIIDVSFKGLFPIRLSGTSSVRLVDVLASANEWNRVVVYAELATDRSLEYWSEDAARSRARDEVLRDLLFLQQSRVRHLTLDDYLKAFKDKHVLVLGDYSEAGRARLSAIAAQLDAIGYVPVLLDEIDDGGRYDLRQKCIAVAHVCAFVVIDDSSKSGHIAEAVLVEAARLVTVVLRMEGSDSTMVTQALSATSKVVLERSYTATSLATVVTEAVEWANARIAEIGQALGSAYPWAGRPRQTKRPP